MRTPDFFLVGAPKCGTTALYAMLGAHPEIFLSPIKEPDYFAADIRAAIRGAYAPNGGRVFRPGDDDLEAYLALFSGAGPNQRLGEGSVSYLASHVAPSAINGQCPDARILMVLRDPADRLFSHYAAAVASGSTGVSFSDWLADVIRRETLDTAPIGPVVAGRYGMNLQRYLSVFPHNRIHIIWHEDFVEDPAGAVRNVFSFLGVDATHDVPVAIRINETRVPRAWLPGRIARLHPSLTVPSPLKPTPSDRTQAIRIYENDVRLLERLTGRDLSRWTDVTG